VGPIVLVIVVNIMVEGSGPPEANPWWWQVFDTLASGVAGLIATVRMHERSWMVIVPTALVLLVAVKELIEGLR
jgi:hypothetical protein